VIPAEPRYARLFTIEEANALLPVIRPRVERMIEAIGRVRTDLDAASRERNSPPEALQRLEESGLPAEIRDLIEEITSHGCLVNGPDAGLVDFPCLFAGEIVLLCWRPGEDSVAHYHRVPDGFAGRRPLIDDRHDSGPVQ
jgi:hypothetical protein